MTTKNVLYLALLLFVLGDLAFTFVQFLQFPADGDMPKIILPTQEYEHVLEDPFGLSVITKDSLYAAPNRFFAHASMSSFFSYAPRIFQQVVEPIESIYYSMAFAKWVIHFGILLLLAIGITAKRNILEKDNLMVLAILTPLFQTMGYNPFMGIIDYSTTYAFFYSSGMLLTGLFFLPWLLRKHSKNSWEFSKLLYVLLALLGIVLAFHGSLNAPCILTFGLLWGVYQLINGWKKTNVKDLTLLVIVGLACLYSMYIGRNNIEGLSDTISIAERYARLPLGLWKQLTTKLGFPILIFATIFQFYLLKRFTIEHDLIRKLALWVGLFFLIYILLLPLGGYRDYRPLIIRRDTFLPITILLFFLYGSSAFKLIQQWKHQLKYIIFLVIVSFVFMNADAKLTPRNACEKQLIKEIVESQNQVIKLTEDCSVISWQTIEDPLYSENAIELLHLWNIIKDEEKRFYFDPALRK